jgi:RimJ/RimL family protein N-acetyltransferase
VLKTKRLLIRPVRADDTEILYEIRRRVARWQGRSEHTLEETRAMYAAMAAHEPGSEAGWHQYVVETEDGAVVGDIGVHFGSPSEAQAEIGYSLHPDHWGHGYAAEALGRLVDHLFDDHGLHRLVATTGADNLRSRALLERVGFRQEAYCVEAFFDRGLGRWVDDVSYGLLARERHQPRR